MIYWDYIVDLLQVRFLFEISCLFYCYVSFIRTQKNFAKNPAKLMSEKCMYNVKFLTNVFHFLVREHLEELYCNIITLYS